MKEREIVPEFAVVKLLHGILCSMLLISFAYTYKEFHQYTHLAFRNNYEYYDSKTLNF